jgi:hypothetical protein
MSQRRTTIATLMKLVVVCAIAFVALKEATETWTLVAFMVVVGVLSDATFRARFGSEEDRVRCSRFALIGWLYFLLWIGSSWSYLPTIFLVPAHIWERPETLVYHENQRIVVHSFMSLVIAYFVDFMTEPCLRYLQRRPSSPVRETPPAVGLSDDAALPK